MTRFPGPLNLSLAVLLPLAAASLTVHAAESYMPAIGGGGGSQFKAPCPSGQNLTGFELRAGDDIDAIHPLCVSAYSTGSVTGPQLTEGPELVVHYRNVERELYGEPYNGLAGDWLTLPDGWYGGIGGGRASVICPHERPIVVAMRVAAEGVNTVSVNNIHLYCGLALPSQQLDDNPSAIFDAPQAVGEPGTFGIGSTQVSRTGAFQRCQEGKVAVGIHGRSGEWLDALGLICDAPRVLPAMALGRVEIEEGGPASNKSICELAKSARARKSPAAPGLERQCAALGHNDTVAFARVKTEGPSPPICDAARSARARKSPAAPGLERQRLAAGGSMDPPAP